MEVFKINNEYIKITYNLFAYKTSVRLKIILGGNVYREKNLIISVVLQLTMY